MKATQKLTEYVVRTTNKTTVPATQHFLSHAGEWKPAASTDTRHPSIMSATVALRNHIAGLHGKPFGEGVLARAACVVHAPSDAGSPDIWSEGAIFGTRAAEENRRRREFDDAQKRAYPEVD